ncbi:MAG: hypothetical protein Q9223_001699 [Gallowayella weberi]
MDAAPRFSEDVISIESPEDQSASGYESAGEEEASRYQVLWTNEMAKGKYRSTSLYNKVEVLLLCWQVADSDMNTAGEVEDLKSVFEKDFGYHTTTERLVANPEKKLQVQVNAKVATFVDRHDGQDTLLIVYYAGHGLPGEFFGDLVLQGYSFHVDLMNAAETSPNLQSNEPKRPPEYRTARTKPFSVEQFRGFTTTCRGGCPGNIRLVSSILYTSIPLQESDPGILAVTLVHWDRLFEYLAAAKAHGLTGVPGPTSFTRALIYALKALVKEKKEGRFTTDELLRKIKTDAPEFPRDQEPVISDRNNKKTSAGRIMLHPLRHNSAARQPSHEESSAKDVTQYVMTLHFDLPGKPLDDHLIALGSNLNDFFERNTIEMLRVRWGGMKATAFTRATRKFLNGHKRRASSQSQQPKMKVDLGPTSTALLGPRDKVLLSPYPPTLVSQDSAGDESCNSPTASLPPTPHGETNMMTNIVDEMGSLEVEGGGDMEAELDKMMEAN